MTYVGIDPGASGGLALINFMGAEAIAMPDDMQQILRWFHRLPENTAAVIEKVGGWIPGSKGNIASRMFEFGKSFGMLLMACESVGITPIQVAPVTWQAALFSSGERKGNKGDGWKRFLRSKAKKLFPSVKVTLATADALLLSEYCLRRVRGTL